ncbi:hypothetical protein GGQ92_000608 [Gracilibacillus halotolerans]|uniref:Uncharacterized protein n=1 Tax=Gracilibacillus halotolerans TaxID=74386 RepID=A0A841RGS5_9BACI|nr:hypothetical protein [Gracilibacillus halotolerans]MBB6511841.1 hypothetical protein [Gracilibacillus halotolerans]
MRFLLTCLLLVAIFSLGVYMGGNTSSENSSEPPVPEVEFVDTTSIKEEVEESTVEIVPLEAEDYEPSVLYTFAENGGNAIGKVANSILTVCSEFIDILF